MNQPPRYTPRKKKKSPLMAVLVTLLVILVVVSLAGGLLYFRYKSTESSSSSGVTINQITQSDGGNKIEVRDVSDVVKVAKPSVVEIVTETLSSGNSIFGQYVSQGAGSGVIMSSDGYIITNNHVIDGASTIEVTTDDGKTYPATLIGKDAQTDLAIIKVDAADLVPAQFGDSTTLEVGDAAIAIGNPLGSLGGTVTTGIISALDREITIDGTTMTLLQTDAAINPGNSGGGLFDANGYLIGIVNAKTSSTGIEGLGFAIPISGAVDIINELIQNGAVTTRAALNVSLQDVTGSSGMFGTPSRNEGVYIVQVVEGGAAANAGLQTGDQIIEFDGQSVTTSAEVKKILSQHSAGDVVNMKIDRNGQQIDVDITLGTSSLS